MELDQFVVSDEVFTSKFMHVVTSSNFTIDGDVLTRPLSFYFIELEASEKAVLFHASVVLGQRLCLAKRVALVQLLKNLEQAHQNRKISSSILTLILPLADYSHSFQAPPNVVAAATY